MSLHHTQVIHAYCSAFAMNLFRMMTIIVLLLVINPWVSFLASSEESTVSGRYFVFTYHPLDWLDLYFFSREAGTTNFYLVCRRTCTSIKETVHRSFQYPEIAIENMEHFPPNVPTDSGKLLPVFSIESTKKLVILFIMIHSIRSFDATILSPITLTGTNYYIMTPMSSGTVIFISYNYTLTLLEIGTKDNANYFETGAPTTIPPMLDTYPLYFPYVNSTPENERLLLFGQTSVYLLAYQSYFLIIRTNYTDMTGMHVKSDKPIQVMQGGNHTTGRGGNNMDIMIDCAEPVDAKGRFYVLPFISINPEVYELKVLTMDAYNTVSVQQDSLVYTAILAGSSDWFSLVIAPGTAVFVSSVYSVTVVKIISRFENDWDVGPCIMSIPTIQQWLNSYVWFPVSSFYDYDQRAYFSVVAHRDHAHYVTFDNLTIPDDQWRDARSFIGNDSEGPFFKFHSRLTKLSRHTVTTPNNPKAVSLVMVYSFSAFVGYCYIPGRRFEKINAPACVKSFAEPGDFLDNDCDGKIDEEAEDNIDNDQDGYIDEDLYPPDKADGSWGEWTPYLCLAPCGQINGIFSRIRKCDNPQPQGDGLPCQGTDREIDGAPCKSPYVKCAHECGVKEWGYNCSKTCRNCIPDCDKVTGKCAKCVAGFTSPFCNRTCKRQCAACDPLGECLNCSAGWRGPPGCDWPCPISFYGIRCMHKCPIHCVNKSCNLQTGVCLECPPGKLGDNCSVDEMEMQEEEREFVEDDYSLYYLPLFTLPFSLMLFIMTCQQQKSKEVYETEEEEEVHRMRLEQMIRQDEIALFSTPVTFGGNDGYADGTSAVRIYTPTGTVEAQPKEDNNIGERKQSEGSLLKVDEEQHREDEDKEDPKIQKKGRSERKRTKKEKKDA